MGAVKTPNIRKRKDGRWEARIVTGHDPQTGKPIRRSIYGHDRKAVEQELNLIRLALGRGNYQQPSRLTLEEWGEVWFSTFAAPLKPATVSKYRSTFNNHVLPVLGAVRLAKIKPWHIQSLYNSLGAGVAKNVQVVLGQIFDAAIKQQYIYSNPCDGAVPPKKETVETEEAPLREEEAAALVEAARGTRWENAIIVCLLCGPRESELLGLSWDDIDFEGKRMTIKQQLNRKKEIVTTKSGRARTFIMPPAVAQALQRERRAQMERRLMAGQDWDNKYNLCFTDELGQPIVESTFFRAVKSLGKQVGRPDVHPHSLRHYCATAAIEAGGSVKAVQSMLGHANASMTMDIYVENTDRQSADTAAKIQARFEIGGVKMGSNG